MTEQDLYADIRPYHDDEVAPAIARLIADDEFIQAILHYRFTHLAGPFGWLLSPLVKFALKRRWSKLNTVQAVQRQVATFMDRMIDKSTNKVTTSGLEHLKPGKAYLFVSNHRDIAMDPALVNWCLHHHGLDTVRIAIGDNLLRKPCATELMKLNKSFIVKRGAKGPREMLKNFSQLSGYIKHSLEQQHSIWIAQKEGRAKDGNDETEPAILKMFYMEGKKRGQDFASYMASLNIVPVCLSYEYDPCDIDKINELWQKQTQGSYQKGEFEDIDSIIKGIVGFKGRVHVAFAKPLVDIPAEPEMLAALIDQQIWQHYRLYPVNYLAAGVEHTSVNEQVAEIWQQRLQAIPQGASPLFSALYAAPLIKKVCNPVKYLIPVTLLWAFSFSLIGVYLAGQVDAYFAVLSRILLAVLVFLPMVKVIPYRLAIQLMALGAVQLGLMYLFYYQSFLLLTVPEVLIFTIFTPVYITLIYDLLNKRFHYRYLLAAVLAVFAAAIMRYETISSDYWMGFAVVQAANLCFAFGQVGYKVLLAETALKVKQHQVFVWFYLGALLVALPAWWFLGSRGFPQQFVHWAVLLWLGLVASGGGYYWWNKGATQVSSGMLAVMNNMLIPAGLLVNIVIWNRNENLLTLAGGAVLLVLSCLLCIGTSRDVTTGAVNGQTN